VRPQGGASVTHFNELIMKLPYLIAVLLGMVVPPSLWAQGPTPSPVVEVYSRTKGDPGVLLKWGVYEPATPGPWPAVIVIHAGAFKSGSRNDDEVVLCAHDLAEAGFLALSISHRLAPPGQIEGQKENLDYGRWPEQYDDVAAAVHAARTDVRCNGWVGAVGGSSGASHAAYVAATGIPGDSRFDAAVCLSGDYDFTDFTGDVTGEVRHGVSNYVGTFNLRKLLKASPIFFVDATVPPLFLVNSTDEFMPLPQLQDMTERLTSLGVINFQTKTLDGSLHAFDYWSQIKEDAIAFLDDNLAPGANGPLRKRVGP
jgi:acetyl esterase/lipase